MTTKTMAVDANNDMYLGSDGNLATATGVAAIETLGLQASKAQLGEMLYAVNKGIPNFQTVWKGTPNIAQFEAALRKTLLSVPGVTEVLSLDTTLINNVLSYTARILTTYGAGVING